MKRSKSSPSCLEGGPWVSHSPVRTHKTQSPLCILFRLLLLAFSGLRMFFPHPCIWSTPVVLQVDNFWLNSLARVIPLFGLALHLNKPLYLSKCVGLPRIAPASSFLPK